MLIGAQLYTVRNFTQTEQDFDKTIEKVAKIGYKYVQISAIGSIEPNKVRNICDRYGIDIILTHTNPDRILNETEEVIQEHNIYDAKYIGIGSMPDKYRKNTDSIKRFINDYLPAARKFKDAGLTFMYHNHNFEFEKFDGKLMFDYLIEGFSPELMGFTVDVFWIQSGGADPSAWIKKLARRIDTIHYKDMKISKNAQLMAEVMEGNLDWEAIFEASKNSGVKYAFVEQDDCNGKDPFECLEISYKNMSKYFDM